MKLRLQGMINFTKQWQRQLELNWIEKIPPKNSLIDSPHDIVLSPYAQNELLCRTNMLILIRRSEGFCHNMRHLLLRLCEVQKWVWRTSRMTTDCFTITSSEMFLKSASSIETGSGLIVLWRRTSPSTYLFSTTQTGSIANSWVICDLSPTKSNQNIWKHMYVSNTCKKKHRPVTTY